MKLLLPLYSKYLCQKMGIECNKKLAVRLIGEFSATAMLMTLLPIACITFPGTLFPINLLQVSIGCGIAVGTCVQCFACVSGAHINPCISISACIVGSMEWGDMCLYICMQLLGALAGFGIYCLIIPWSIVQKNPCYTIPLRSVEWYEAFAIEFVLTATLVLLFLSCIDPRNIVTKETIAIKFAHVITGIVLFGCYFTGASVNPARTLAPALVFNRWERIWIYFVSQPLAAIAMGLAWKYIYADKEGGGGGGGDD